MRLLNHCIYLFYQTIPQLFWNRGCTQFSRKQRCGQLWRFILQCTHVCITGGKHCDCWLCKIRVVDCLHECVCVCLVCVTNLNAIVDRTMRVMSSTPPSTDPTITRVNCHPIQREGRYRQARAHTHTHTHRTTRSVSTTTQDLN